MGQNINLKIERKTHDLNHDLTFSGQCLEYVLGMYNFGLTPNIFFLKMQQIRNIARFVHLRPLSQSSF